MDGKIGYFIGLFIEISIELHQVVGKNKMWSLGKYILIVELLVSNITFTQLYGHVSTMCVSKTGHINSIQICIEGNSTRSNECNLLISLCILF